MPRFAADLGGVSLGPRDNAALLGADAAGALTAGMLLEEPGPAQGARRHCHRADATVVRTPIGGFCTVATTTLLSAGALLFLAGFLELSFNSMRRTLCAACMPQSITGVASSACL